MKRILVLLCALSILACKEEPKDYVTLSGKISNPHESKTLKIYKDKDFEKVITVNEDGTFSDTLKVAEGDYTLRHGDELGSIYLKNGFESSFDRIWNLESFNFVFLKMSETIPICKIRSPDLKVKKLEKEKMK